VAKQWLETFPNIRLRSLSWDYNCVGLVFGSRRTAIDVRHLARIFTDDGYEPILEANVQPGDIAVYRDFHGDFAHVGFVVEYSPNIMDATFNIVVLSQWGDTGEYIHPVRGVPDSWLGRPIEFWSEKKQ
jgi:hypothetical protein